MHGDVSARASRRLAVAVVSIVLPSLVLGYFGVRALAERSNNLGTTYTATTVLVRDRLATELTHLESDLAIELARLGPRVADPATASAWLRGLRADKAWLADPFLIQPGGGVMTSDLSAGWSHVDSSAPSDQRDARSLPTTVITEAEAAEFVAGNLDRALQQYRQALASTSTEAARGLVLMRVGRTLFKLGRFDDAIVAYRGVLSLPPEITDRHGIPYAVNALLQIEDALEALGRPSERASCQRELLEFIVNHPWDVEAGYGYYLARAIESAHGTDGALLLRASTLTRAAVTIQWIRREIQPRVAKDLQAGGCSETTARRLAFQRDAQTVLVGCVALSGAAGKDVRTVLGYEIRPEYVAGAMLASVLKTVDLGQELRVEVLGDHNHQSRTAAAPRPTPLAQASVGTVLPGWSVGLFHRDGRSIERLVRRERWIYGTLIGGMALALILGATLTVRASARQSELSRLKSEFVSNVSHELKTPLALIRMFAETLESGIVSDEAKRQEFYAIIRRESDRLTHLINNVLDVARIDAGTKQYIFAEGDVVALVREAIDAYRPLFDRLGFAVDTVLPDTPIFVSMDRHALTQAMVNLFQNAIKYSGDVKKVAVSLDVRDDVVRLSVADHGVGIRPDEIPRIFETHYRIRLDGSPGSPGSGLGLSIVRHALEAHGGGVEVESTLNRGSVFTLVVPLRHVQS